MISTARTLSQAARSPEFEFCFVDVEITVSWSHGIVMTKFKFYWPQFLLAGTSLLETL